MNKVLFSRVRGSAAVMIIAATPFQAAHSQTALPAAAVLSIDSVFAPYSGAQTPGCAVGVIRDGQLVFARGYGIADLQNGIRITPSSIFNVASIAKQFTAFGILLLEREGKLRLDDDIRTYLPEVPDFGHRITIRHLLHHTSGLRDQYSLLAWGGWRAGEPASETDILRLVSRQRALNFGPGAQYMYSNTGYTLLGTIVHRVSGKSLREFTTERIFTPLGMASTRFYDDHTMIVPGGTAAYDPRQVNGAPDGGRGAPASAASVDNFRISIQVDGHAGATNLFTTVEDMARWERNFLQPTVGDARMIQQMNQRGWLNSGDSIPHALALTHGEFRGRRTISYNGTGDGYRADYLRFPDQRTAFTTLCNIGGVNPTQINRRLAVVVLADKLGPVSAALTAPATPLEVPLSPASLRELAGVYVDTSRAEIRVVFYRDSTRSLHTSNAANAPRLVHVGNDEFAIAGSPVRVRFLRAGNTIIGLVELPSSGPPVGVGAGMSLRDGPTAFIRMLGAVTTAEARVAFDGRYRSDELDVEWVFTASPHGLVLARSRFPDRLVEPAEALDMYRTGVGIARFTRDANGAVTGFTLSDTRSKNVRFDRIRGVP